MVKKLLVLIAIATLFIVVLVFFRSSQNQDDAIIDSYEDCVAAGYPILEIYPEQCNVPDGPSFTRQIN